MSEQPQIEPLLSLGTEIAIIVVLLVAMMAWLLYLKHEFGTQTLARTQGTEPEEMQWMVSRTLYRNKLRRKQAEKRQAAKEEAAKAEAEAKEGAEEEESKEGAAEEQAADSKAADTPANK